MTNPLLKLGDQGQSVWLDYLHQKILEDGELKRLIEADGLKGLTSNPSIFEKAIGGGDDYDTRLNAALDAGDADIMTLYEHLAIGDIQGAADELRPVYERLNGLDGYVSLEVSPYLAMDTVATIAEARRLWRAVDRPNLMIKVPGTKAGAPAITQLISEGINVNVTLLFAIDAYLAVSEAYIAGLEALKRRGGDVAKTHSVASFFLSRIDVAMDKKIAQHRNGSANDERELLRGKAAIASAKIAYQHYLTLIDSPRWKALAGAGAAPQRLLWASTSTKDPSYSDVLYVSELIGPDTVNTMPPKTMDAFRNHGEVRASLTENVEQARDVLASLERLGLNLNQVTDELVDEGVGLFARSFDALLGAVANKRVAILGDKLNRQMIAASSTLDAAWHVVLKRALAEGWTRRLWAEDASLWTGAGEGAWLGWLGAGRGEAMDLSALAVLQSDVKAGDFSHALLMGMGGSSLGAEVFSQTFALTDGFPKLLVLDSTDPAEIARIEAEIDLRRTLFIVSSKSGSTLEPNVLHDYFLRARPAKPWARKRLPHIGLQSLIRIHHWTHLRDAKVSGTSFMAGRKLAGAIRCCRILVWFRQRSLASMSRSSWTRRALCSVRAARMRQLPQIQGFSWCVVGRAAALAGRDKVTICAATDCGFRRMVGTIARRVDGQAWQGISPGK